MRTVKLSIIQMDAIMAAINAIRTNKIKFGLRIRLSELENAVKPYLSAFYAEREQMVEEFAERDEDGQIIKHVEGELTTFQFSDTDAVNARWAEITSVTAEIQVAITLSDLEDVVGGPEMEVLAAVL